MVAKNSDAGSSTSVRDPAMPCRGRRGPAAAALWPAGTMAATGPKVVQSTQRKQRGRDVAYKQRLEMLIGDSIDNLVKRIMRLILQDTDEAQSELHKIMLDLFEKIGITGAEDCRPEAHVFFQRFAEITWSELVDECFAEGSMKLIPSHSTFFQALGFLRRISCYMPCVKRMWDKRYRIVTNIGILMVFDGEVTPLRHFIWQECLKILYNCLVLCTEEDIKYICKLQIFDCLEVAWKISNERLNLGLLVKVWLVLAEHYHIPICKQIWDRSSLTHIIHFLTMENEYEMPGVHVARKAIMAVTNPEEYKKNPFVHYSRKARYIATITDIETKPPEMFPTICSSPPCNQLEDAQCHFRTCKSCHLTYYCSKACQKFHWKHGHKEECIPVYPREEIQKYYADDVINDFQLYCMSLSNNKMLESIMGQPIPKCKKGDDVHRLGVLVKNERGEWVTIDEQIPDAKKIFPYTRRNNPKE